MLSRFEFGSCLSLKSQKVGDMIVPVAIRDVFSRKTVDVSDNCFVQERQAYLCNASLPRVPRSQ